MTMPAVANPLDLVKLCIETDASQGPDALTVPLRTLMPTLTFEHVLTRGRWHRLGGIVDGQYQRVSENITQWAEAECDGDVEALIGRYMDAGYFATQLAGKTHYFTAPCGENAEDFIQLEIEELQEVLDRPLVDRDWFPDSLEEFVDPLDYPRLAPEPIGKPYFQFRRVTPIAALCSDAQPHSARMQHLRRFLNDWQHSSAFGKDPFCRHWVLGLREYVDSHGETRLSVKPISSFSEQLPEVLPSQSLQGVELANAIHRYDRRLGYPFAWYFMLLSGKAANHDLAKAVLHDQMGAYAYLPAKDLAVLRQWGERPYAV